MCYNIITTEEGKPQQTGKGNKMKYTLKDLIAFVNRVDSYEKMNIAEDWIEAHVQDKKIKYRLFDELMTKEKELERKETESFLKEIEADERAMKLRAIYKY